MHAGGGLFGDADDLRAFAAVPAVVDRELGLDRGIELALFLALRVGQQRGVFLGALAQVHQQRRIAAVVEDHVRAFAVAALGAEFEDAMRVVPIVLQRFALVGEHRRALLHQRRGSVVLRREDVARGPAHGRAQRLQRLHQHRGLDRHVQAAGDASALQRLRFGVLGADRHQRRHLALGNADFPAAPVGKRQVGHGVLVGVQRLQDSVHRKAPSGDVPAAIR